MNETLPWINTMLNLLIIPGIILLNGVKKEMAKTNANLSEHISVDREIFKSIEDKLIRIERIQDGVERRK